MKTKLQMRAMAVHILMGSFLLRPAFAENLLETKKLMSAICDSPEQVEQHWSSNWGSTQTVCSACPRYISNDTTALHYFGSYTGHLSNLRNREAIVVTDGCSRYGGSILLRKTPTGWTRVAYESGLRPTECLTFRKSQGNETLACLDSSMHAGLYSYHVNQINIELESFKIIGILNNVLGGNDAGAEKGYKYAYSITPKSFKKTVFGNHPALTIEIEGKKEKAVPSANGEFLDVTPTTKTEKHFTLIYLFDGSHFSPTKETVQTLTEITHFLD